MFIVLGWLDGQVQHQPYTVPRMLFLTFSSPGEPRNSELEFKDLILEQNLKVGKEKRRWA